MDTDDLAAEMYAECVESEQSARWIPDPQHADAVRARLRALARAGNVRIRTARMDDAVVAVRLDAQVWHDTTAVMREKLTPPARGSSGKVD